MNSKEHQKAFERFAKKVTSSKKEGAKFLVRAGIHNKNGKLSEAYVAK